MQPFPLLPPPPCAVILFILTFHLFTFAFVLFTFHFDHGSKVAESALLLTGSRRAHFQCK